MEGMSKQYTCYLFPGGVGGGGGGEGILLPFFFFVFCSLFCLLCLGLACLPFLFEYISEIPGDVTKSRFEQVSLCCRTIPS